MKRNDKVYTWTPLKPIIRNVINSSDVVKLEARSPCGLVTTRLSEVVQGRRPHVSQTATRPATSLPFPSLRLRIRSHSRPRRYLFYGPLTFTAAKITLQLQTTTVFGRHCKFISSWVLTRNLQPFWHLKQNSYLTAISLVTTSNYWNVVTNSWVWSIWSSG